MKTITQLLLLASVCFASSAFSQTSIGFTAGTSLATFKSTLDHATALSSKAGFTAGVLLDHTVSSHFSVQPALNFVQKGAKEKDGTDKTTLNYLELPVNLIYNTNKNHGFFIGGGPAVAAGLSGKDTYTYNGSPTTDDVKFGKDKDLKRMEISANVLAGYRFRQGLQLAVNYNLGLSNLIADQTVNNGKLTNRYFGIRLGYLISSYKKP